ncbi:MAG: (d)CMP kinase [Deltaproteobacteria bacterium]|nr:(d)CMP kinase [Deltaproteobacteria bacterium]
MKKIIVAIDGPSGSGKSTVAKRLAGRLGYMYIDTGAMYRAVALQAKRDNIDINDSASLIRLCESVRLEFVPDNGGLRTILNGEDVSEAIRTPEMSMAASDISARKEVRQALLSLQRRMGENGGVVLEGRDVGTVIFPNAEAKFFLDASLEERGKRRYKELAAKGMDVTLEQTIEDVRKRDINDSSREIAPLKMADDAVLVDSTNIGVEEVVEKMIEVVQDKIGR